MNKITEDGNQAGAPIRLETVNRSRLGTFWKHGILSGHFWRLYRNSGEGAGVLVGGRRRALRPDRLYLLPPDCNFRTYCRNPEIEQLYLHFETPGLSGAENEALYELEITPESGLAVRELEEGITAGSPLNPLRAVALACMALTRLPENSLKSRRSDQAMERAINFLHGNLGASVRLNELAGRAGLNVNHFIARFRAAAGSTPYRYLNSLRYARAARLLTETEQSVDEICLAVGIADRFHFSREFKRRYGLPPVAYRQARRS